MPPKSHLKAFIRSHARPTNTPDTSGWQPGVIVRYCRACRGLREPHLEGCPNVDVCKELRMQPLPRQDRRVDDAAAPAPAPEDLRVGRDDADGSAAHDDEEFDASKINSLVKAHLLELTAAASFPKGYANGVKRVQFWKGHGNTIWFEEKGDADAAHMNELPSFEKSVRSTYVVGLLSPEDAWGIKSPCPHCLSSKTDTSGWSFTNSSSALKIVARMRRIALLVSKRVKCHSCNRTFSTDDPRSLGLIKPRWLVDAELGVAQEQRFGTMWLAEDTMDHLVLCMSDSQGAAHVQRTLYAMHMRQILNAQKLYYERRAWVLELPAGARREAAAARRRMDDPRELFQPTAPTEDALELRRWPKAEALCCVPTSDVLLDRRKREGARELAYRRREIQNVTIGDIDNACADHTFFTAGLVRDRDAKCMAGLWNCRTGEMLAATFAPNTKAAYVASMMAAVRVRSKRGMPSGRFAALCVDNAPAGTELYRRAAPDRPNLAVNQDIFHVDGRLKRCVRTFLKSEMTEFVDDIRKLWFRYDEYDVETVEQYYSADRADRDFYLRFGPAGSKQLRYYTESCELVTLRFNKLYDKWKTRASADGVPFVLNKRQWKKTIDTQVSKVHLALDDHSRTIFTEVDRPAVARGQLMPTKMRKRKREGPPVWGTDRGSNPAETGHAALPDMMAAACGGELANVLMHVGVARYNRARRVAANIDFDRGDNNELVDEINELSAKLDGSMLYDDKAPLEEDNGERFFVEGLAKIVADVSNGVDTFDIALADAAAAAEAQSPDEADAGGPAPPLVGVPPDAPRAPSSAAPAPAPRRRRPPPAPIAPAPPRPAPVPKRPAQAVSLGAGAPPQSVLRPEARAAIMANAFASLGREGFAGAAQTAAPYPFGPPAPWAPNPYALFGAGFPPFAPTHAASPRAAVASPLDPSATPGGGAPVLAGPPPTASDMTAAAPSPAVAPKPRSRSGPRARDCKTPCAPTCPFLLEKQRRLAATPPESIHGLNISLHAVDCPRRLALNQRKAR